MFLVSSALAASMASYMNIAAAYHRWKILPLDCLLVALSFYLSWVLRFDSLLPEEWPAFPGWQLYFSYFYIHLACAVFSLIFAGIYRNLWPYASLRDIYQILKISLLSAFLSISIMWLFNRMEHVPRSTLVIEYLLFFMFLSMRSFSWRIIRDLYLLYYERHRKRTLIIGVNHAASYIVREMQSGHLAYHPVAFLHHGEGKSKYWIQGLPVLSNMDNFEAILKKYRIEQVIMTETEKVSSASMRLFHRLCDQNNVDCKTMPPLERLLKSKKELSQSMRNIVLEDLLGRESVSLEDDKIYKLVQNKSILITGAGGSIGSELCLQLLRYRPAALILYEAAENALYEIEQVLRSSKFLDSQTRIIPIVGDIRDEICLERTFYENDIQIIFHCAAYKHVPLMELNPGQAISNNLIGTVTLVDFAQRNGVECLVMLSTDKAVRPANVMGASKRIAELYIQNLSRASDMRFIIVRFGNVLGSQGSVVPLFAKQIEQGGPITLTHPEVTRYFMTIPEAVGLVLQASSMGKGGEIFVLDMGEPLKIQELAEDMIRCAGLKPYKDITLQYTGLRAGEKLYEELFLENENKLATAHPQIYLSYGPSYPLAKLNKQIAELRNAAQCKQRAEIDAIISTILPEYKPVYRFAQKLRQTEPAKPESFL